MVKDNQRVPLGTKRLAVFKIKGTDCVTCGIKGTHFVLESHIDVVDNPGTALTPHLNLYTDDGTLMTVDHTVALADGGAKDMTNLQPMCKPCNGEKSSIKDKEKRARTEEIKSARL